MAFQGTAYGGLIRIGIGRQQGGRGDHDAAAAVAALHSLLFDKCLLQEIRGIAITQAFQGCDLFVLNLTDRQNTGADRYSIEHYGTGAALAQPAAEAAAVYVEVIAQYIQQRGVRWDIDAFKPAV